MRMHRRPRAVRSAVSAPAARGPRQLRDRFATHGLTLNPPVRRPQAESLARIGQELARIGHRPPLLRGGPCCASFTAAIRGVRGAAWRYPSGAISANRTISANQILRRRSGGNDGGRLPNPALRGPRRPRGAGCGAHRHGNIRPPQKAGGKALGERKPRSKASDFFDTGGHPANAARAASASAASRIPRKLSPCPASARRTVRRWTPSRKAAWSRLRAGAVRSISPSAAANRALLSPPGRRPRVRHGANLVRTYSYLPNAARSERRRVIITCIPIPLPCQPCGTEFRWLVPASAHCPVRQGLDLGPCHASPLTCRSSQFIEGRPCPITVAPPSRPAPPGPAAQRRSRRRGRAGAGGFGCPLATDHGNRRCRRMNARLGARTARPHFSRPLRRRAALEAAAPPPVGPGLPPCVRAALWKRPANGGAAALRVAEPAARTAVP